LQGRESQAREGDRDKKGDWHERESGRSKRNRRMEEKGEREDGGWREREDWLGESSVKNCREEREVGKLKIWV
jgi:hypothetical protein